MPTQTLVVASLSATHLHNTHDQASFHWEYKCSAYFRYQVNFLVFFFPVSNLHSCIKMSKGSSCQYPTCVYVCVCVCTYMCMRSYMCVCVFCVCAHRYVCMCANTYVYTHNLSLIQMKSNNIVGCFMKTII